MIKKSTIAYSVLFAAGVCGWCFSAPTVAGGFGPMNMMNPGKWFGGNNDRYDDYYDDRWGGRGPGYGYGGPPPFAYGAPPPGAYGGGPPRGAYGYGAPSYGTYGYPAQAYPAPAYTAPVPATVSDDGSDSKSATVSGRSERNDQWEASQRPTETPDSGYGGAGYSSPEPGSGMAGMGGYGSGSQNLTFRPLDR